MNAARWWAVFRRNGRGDAGLRTQIVAFTLARLVLNTGHRMVYPFLPAIARGVGVRWKRLRSR